MSLLEIQDGANWDLIYTDTKLVAPGNKPGTYIPIQAFTIPVLFDKKIIAIQLNSTNVNPSWFLGARVTQVVKSLGVTSQEYWGNQFKCGINRTTFKILPDLAPQYALHVWVPRWIQDLEISVAEYTGPVGEALSDLERIEGKLDVFSLT